MIGMKKVGIGILSAVLIGGLTATAGFGFEYLSARDNDRIESVDNASGNRFEDAAVDEADALSGELQSTESEVLVKLLDVSDMVETAIKSVVAVNCVEYQTYNNGYYGFMYGQHGTVEVPSCGTGIIISRRDGDLIILTNNHVVEDADKVSIVFVNEKEIEARVLGTAPDSDIALVAVKLSDIDDETMQAIEIAPMGDSDAVKVGSPAIAIGNALGYGQSVTTGVISALNRTVNLVDMSLELIQTDAPINSGNSGGPLLNADGEVIGINSVKYADTGVEGMGYAIPINTAKPIIEEILNPTEVTEPKEQEKKVYLGIYAIDVTFQYQFMYGMPAGVYVTQVAENSPAAQAGIEAGDIITSIDGTAITSMAELSELLAKYNEGDTVTLGLKVIKRNSYRDDSIRVVLGSTVVE